MTIALLVGLLAESGFAQGRRSAGADGVDVAPPGAAVRGAARERKARARVPAAETAPAPAVPGGAAGGSPPAPPSGVDVEAEKARVEEMQALSEQHVRELAQGSEQFTARMQAAKTREERSAIQQEFQRFQAEKNAAFQQRMTELRGRR